MKKLITRKSLPEQLHDHIKTMILSGELKGGERIPEAQLSQLFGVSRTPLRDALKKLNTYGLICLEPRSYAEVAVISEDEAKKIAVVRLDLEILSAKLFSEHASAEKYDEIKQISDKCFEAANAGEKAEALEQDSKFHLKIAEYCGNSILYEIYERLDARVQLLRLNQRLDLETLKDYIKQHNLLITAIKNREERFISSILTTHIMHDFHK
ncbi:MAG: GntR family transcriptional regulator [Bacteroidetes bacterium]|nr:GntR family transcriptional regulator [Bacteroidota bacterium]